MVAVLCVMQHAVAPCLSSDTEIFWTMLNVVSLPALYSGLLHSASGPRAGLPESERLFKIGSVSPARDRKHY